MRKMIAFRTHARGDRFIRRGEVFEVPEHEVHAYLARKNNPLAGPLDDEADSSEPASSPEPEEPPKKRTRKRSR